MRFIFKTPRNGPVRKGRRLAALTVAAILALFGAAKGQQLSSFVIASQGGTLAVPELRLDWTLGESFISGFQSGSTRLTTGFHQPIVIPQTSTTVEFGQTPRVAVWPNPAQDLAYFKMENAGQQASCQLTDALGRVVWAKARVEPDWANAIPLGGLPNGVYFLAVSNPNGLAARHKIQVVR